MSLLPADIQFNPSDREAQDSLSLSSTTKIPSPPPPAPGLNPVKPSPSSQENEPLQPQSLPPSQLPSAISGASSVTAFQPSGFTSQTVLQPSSLETSGQSPSPTFPLEKSTAPSPAIPEPSTSSASSASVLSADETFPVSADPLSSHTSLASSSISLARSSSSATSASSGLSDSAGAVSSGTASPTADEGSSGDASINVVAIVVPVVLGVFLLFCLLFCFLWWRRRRIRGIYQHGNRSHDTELSGLSPHVQISPNEKSLSHAEVRENDCTVVPMPIYDENEGEIQPMQSTLFPRTSPNLGFDVYPPLPESPATTPGQARNSHGSEWPTQGGAHQATSLARAAAARRKPARPKGESGASQAYSLSSPDLNKPRPPLPFHSYSSNGSPKSPFDHSDDNDNDDNTGAELGAQEQRQQEDHYRSPNSMAQARRSRHVNDDGISEITVSSSQHNNSRLAAVRGVRTSDEISDVSSLGDHEGDGDRERDNEQQHDAFPSKRTSRKSFTTLPALPERHPEHDSGPTGNS